MARARGIVIQMTRLRLVAALLFVVLAAKPMTAQFVTTDVSQYAHSAWLAREGAFRGNAYDITQTTDGNLWISSPFGLLKFDGTSFTPSAPKGAQEFQNTYVEKVLGAKDGSLWIGGTGLFRVKDGRLISIPELAGSVVHALLEDHTGAIWAGARTRGSVNTLCRIRAASTECFVDETKTFGIEIKHLFEDKAGRLWISAENGVWRWAPGKPEFFPERPGDAGVGVDSDDLMIATKKYQSDGAPRERSHFFSRIPSTISDIADSTLLTDHQGGLWIGTKGHGLIHSLHGRIDTYTPADGLSSEIIYSLFEDREQDIWAVTANGIDRFRQSAVTLVTTRQGLSSNSVHSLLSDGRTMWLAMENGLDRVRDREIKGFKARDGVSLANISAMFAGPGGRTLITVGQPDGIVWLEHEHLTIQHAPLGDDTYVVTPDEADGVWVSNRQSGLMHIPRTGKPTEILPWGRFDHKAAYTMAFDPVRKGLWLAFNRGDLLFFRDGQERERYRIENRPLQNPRDLRVDIDGTVWLGSNAGLTRLRDSAIATLSGRNGLPCDGEHWRQEDDRHAIWMETPCGVVKLAPGELDRWSRDPNSHVKVEAYLDNLDGAENGIAGGPYSPNVAITLDGRIAYGTKTGLAIIDPHQEIRNLQKPPVHVDLIEADAVTYPVNKLIVLAPNVHVVRLAYSALSFRAPQKVRFRYKLEGYDTKWSEVLSTHEAVYTNLPPKAYRFHVIACNDSGIWNDVGDTIDFSVGAAYYQTRWFMWTFVATLAILLWLAYHARVRYLYRDVSNRIQAQTSERLNVSRDLHDTLLQGIQGLILSFHALSEDNNVDDSVRKRVSALTGRAEEVLIDGRERIRALRFENYPSHGFVEQLRALARLIHPGHLPALQISMEGEEVPLDPIIFEEICLMCREAMSNAFRHSGAQNVDIVVIYSRSRFSVNICDNGRGIRPEARQSVTSKGHWGIVGMRERAVRIGARLDIKTPYPGEPNPGTDILIELPSVLAYAHAKKSK
jgi:signal transduction histidine kinase/ligand-binding sensor domain-containing protein